jgi:hypothetical protein
MEREQLVESFSHVATLFAENAAKMNRSAMRRPDAADRESSPPPGAEA